MDVAKRLDALRRLLEQKQQAPAEEVVDAVFDEPPAPAVVHQQVDQCPPSLQGLTYGQIRLAEIDGALSDAELLWFSGRRGPEIPGIFRYPNFKLINRRSGI